jgi:hypothetical protein
VTRNTETLAGNLTLEILDTRATEPIHNSIAAAIGAMDQLTSLHNDLTAVFASTDTYALGALRWARVHGISVPEQPSIVGFDNIESAEFAVTSLSRFSRLRPSTVTSTFAMSASTPRRSVRPVRDGGRRELPRNCRSRRTAANLISPTGL